MTGARVVADLLSACDSCFETLLSGGGLASRGLLPAIPAIGCFIGHTLVEKVYLFWSKERPFSGRSAPHYGKQSVQNLFPPREIRSTSHSPVQP
jgi:hypothetical protein